MVVDVLQHGHPAGPGQHGAGIGQRPAVGGGQDPPVDGEAGHRPQDGLVGQQDRGLETGQLGAEGVQPDAVDEDRADPPAGRQQPPQGVGALGHEEPVVAVAAGLHPPPGPGVVELPVVVDPGVARVGDRDGDLAHGGEVTFLLH